LTERFSGYSQVLFVHDLIQLRKIMPAFSRRHARKVPEAFGKILAGAEAAIQCDFGDGLVGGFEPCFEPFAGLFKTQATEVFLPMTIVCCSEVRNRWIRALDGEV